MFTREDGNLASKFYQKLGMFTIEDGNFTQKSENFTRKSHNFSRILEILPRKLGKFQVI